MALSIPCQMPGAIYHSFIEDNKITVVIDLGRDPLMLNQRGRRLLEANLYNAIEPVLAPLYPHEPAIMPSMDIIQNHPDYNETAKFWYEAGHNAGRQLGEGRGWQQGVRSFKSRLRHWLDPQSLTA